MDRASATEAVYAGSIPVGSNQRLKKKKERVRSEACQLALELGLKEARLDTEVRYFEPFEIGSQRQLQGEIQGLIFFGSPGSFLRSHNGQSFLLKRSEKSNFTFQSDVVPETDHEAAVFSSRPAHRAESPIVNRGPAAGSFSRAEKQDTTER